MFFRFDGGVEKTQETIHTEATFEILQVSREDTRRRVVLCECEFDIYIQSEK